MSPVADRIGCRSPRNQNQAAATLGLVSSSSSLSFSIRSDSPAVHGVGSRVFRGSAAKPRFGRSLSLTPKALLDATLCLPCTIS
jgi:hypothetical protein